MQKVDEKYLNSDLKVEKGNRLHRLVAMLFDTWYDDLTEDRIAEVEQHVESFRWMNASAERVDQ